MWVGISSVGVFETRDGGATWATRNKGVRAGFQPDIYPEFGQCVHKLVMAADGGEHLYQQNHCGVYRSTDGGAQWEEITTGLPSEFGFPMTAHPRDPQTVWTIPLNGADQGRFMPDASAAVWRTHDGGDTWVRSGDGLPQQDAYLQVLREAMANDGLDPVGIYFGTSTGQLYGSADEGRSWSLDRRQPAADLVRRGGRRWLTGRPARSSTSRARWSPCSRARRGASRHTGRRSPRSSRTSTARCPGIGIRVLDAGPEPARPPQRVRRRRPGRARRRRSRPAPTSTSSRRSRAAEPGAAARAQARLGPVRRLVVDVAHELRQPRVAELLADRLVLARVVPVVVDHRAGAGCRTSSPIGLPRLTAARAGAPSSRVSSHGSACGRDRPPGREDLGELRRRARARRTANCSCDLRVTASIPCAAGQEVALLLPGEVADVPAEAVHRPEAAPGVLGRHAARRRAGTRRA